jgi:hypothetical protein
MNVPFFESSKAFEDLGLLLGAVLLIYSWHRAGSGMVSETKRGVLSMAKCGYSYFGVTLL